MNYEYDRILQSILDIGEEMIVAGAEVSRVENSIYRMCEAYGADRINVFIIISNIQVTLEAPDGRILTQIRQVVRNEVNFDRLDYLNDLSRKICAEKPDAEKMQEMFAAVMNRPQQSHLLKFLGAVLVSGGFTIFFGGNGQDCIAAAIVGVVIILSEVFLARREKNQIVYHFVTSAAAGIAAILLVRIGLGYNADKIMIGGIMLLIPGIAMTNAMRDMLIGDLASGMLRLTNAILVAAAIAGGFAFAIIVLGGVL